ncbi:MAG: nucleotide-binding universal stress UspA family protein [Cyclobacteriaceae bacterium]|jgi:nucleotide-binding universal stress UspA family protein
MYKFNKILVGLDRTEIDYDLIKAASDICELSGAQEVFFINIIKDFHMPDSLLKEFPGLLDKAVKERQELLEADVKNNFKYSEVKITVNVIVEHGQVTKNLLKIASEEKVDLIVLGRKNEKKGGGVLLNRIARRAGCSLLIVPKGAEFKTDTILVPTDFSDYSKQAMDKAISFARKSKSHVKIVVQNVYIVPTGYHYTGKSFEEFGVIMKENAKKDYHVFINQFDIEGFDVVDVYSLDKDDDIITDIFRSAKTRKANLIIIGAKGRTATTALFIGSKAEKLIQLESHTPLLVIRPKGKRAGLLEYIQEL